MFKLSSHNEIPENASFSEGCTNTIMKSNEIQRILIPVYFACFVTKILVYYTCVNYALINQVCNLYLCIYLLNFVLQS